MKYTIFITLTLTLMSFILTSANAKFTITRPNERNWWIASESQTFAWTSSSSDPDQFIVIIKNDNEDILPSK